MNPSGGSHHDGAGPFGYAFYEPASEAPSIPANGGSTLLNPSENDYINNFFLTQQNQDFTTSHDFDMAVQQAQQELHGTNMQFGWLMNEAPPQLMGAHATPKPMPAPQTPSYHPMQMQQAPQQQFNFEAFPDANDLLGGSVHTAMLSQTPVMGHHMHHASSHGLHTPSLVSGPSTEASEILHTADPMHGLPVAASSSLFIPPATITAHEHEIISAAQSLGNLPQLDTAQDLHLEGPQTAPARMDDPNESRLYRFGSDQHFSYEGFRPPSDVAEAHDVISERLTKELKMLKPINRSSTPTRVSSPSQQQNHSHKRTLSYLDAGGADDEDHTDRPIKRRKDSDDDTAKRKFQVPNPRLRRVSGASGDPSSAKRRRSSISAAAKQTRENLTESQKRENHIQSEQKRRNLIKQGFDELRRIVPELRGGGLSKSMELAEVSKFLEQVINANLEMRRRLGLPPPG